MQCHALRPGLLGRDKGEFIRNYCHVSRRPFFKVCRVAFVSARCSVVPFLTRKGEKRCECERAFLRRKDHLFKERSPLALALQNSPFALLLLLLQLQQQR